MIVALALSLLVSVALGVVALRALWPRGVARPSALIVALATGLGAGASALLLFGWMLAFGPGRAFPLAEAAGLGIAALVARRRLAAGTAAATPPGAGSTLVTRVLALAFAVTLVAAVLAFGATLLLHPHGEWDAWMNWNLRARMFFRGGDQWRDGFSGAIPWSHPDYPVMVPTLVTRGWLYVGRETQLGPSLVAATFTFGTVGLLGAALATLRSTSQGLLAALVLLGTPFFLLHGTTLYADVPLGFFFLATFVCLALDARHGGDTGRFLTLAGIAAGLSMCTKNEGLLFTLGLGAGLLVAGRHEGWPRLRRRAQAFLLGLLPFLLLTAAFKAAFAPPNDLISTLGFEHTLGRLTTPSRYVITLREYVSHFTGFGNNGIGTGAWLLVACLLGLGINRGEMARPWVRATAAGLVLVMAGHYVVFVSMAHELSRLLASSLDRLLLQLWPAALFLFFMMTRTPEEAERRGARRTADERDGHRPVAT